MVKAVEQTATRSPSKRRLLASVIITAILASLTYQLGNWQTRRAEQKAETLNQQRIALEAAPITPSARNISMPESAYRQLDLEGHWAEGSLVYVDNRQVNGKPAVQVVQGFQPLGASYLIPVDRGLLLRDPREPRRAPDFPPEAKVADAQSAKVRLQATVLPRFARAAELRGLGLGDEGEVLKSESNGYRVWSNFNTQSYSEAMGFAVSNYVATLQPVVFSKEQDNALQKVNGFYLNAVKLPEQVAKHKGYAFQWYSLTLVLCLLSALFVYREYFKKSDS